MIPFNLLGPIGNAKSQDSRIRSHDTDIQRLMRMLQEMMMGSGSAVGNTPDFVPSFEGFFPGGGGDADSVKSWEGLLTSDLDAPSDGKTAATTATAQAWDSDPDSVTDPVEMIDSDEDEFTLTNRDENLSLASGTYVQWFKKKLANGNYEYKIFDWSCE